MKETGIIRRIDDLGRVVIPKEIRRTFRIKEGDPLEIFVQDDGITFKKYSVMKSIQDFAGLLCESVMKSSGQAIAVTDSDSVVKTQGAHCAKAYGHRMSQEYYDMMNLHHAYSHSSGEDAVYLDEDHNVQVYTIVPIIVDGEVMGSVTSATPTKNRKESDLQYTILKQVATFLEGYLS